MFKKILYLIAVLGLLITADVTYGKLDFSRQNNNIYAPCEQEGYLKIDGLYQYHKTDHYFNDTGGGGLVCDTNYLGYGILIGNILISTGGIFYNGIGPDFESLLSILVLTFLFSGLLYLSLRVFYRKIDILKSGYFIRKAVYIILAIIYLGLTLISISKIFPEAFAGCAARAYYNIYSNIIHITFLFFLFSFIKLWLIFDYKKDTSFVSIRPSGLNILSLIFISYFFVQIDKLSQIEYGILLWLVFCIFIVGTYIYEVKKLYPFASKLDKVILILFIVFLTIAFKILFNN